MFGRDRGDRGALVALGMALFAIVLIAFIEAEGPSNKTVNQQADDQQTTETDYRGPAEGYWWPEFSARDTYAQWAMSVLAIAATAISIWAVRLLKATLQATRDAVAVANRTADDAKRIGRAQVRAYLSCAGGTIHFDDEGFWAQICVKNNGQSPTKAIEISDAKLSYYISGKANLGIGFKSEMTHAPNISAGESEFAKILFENIGEGNFPIFKDVTINVTIRWLDVFDCWDSVEYRLSKDGDVLKSHKV